MSDFGPKITIKIVESLREDILAGKLKSGPEIKVCFLFHWLILCNYQHVLVKNVEIIL